MPTEKPFNRKDSQTTDCIEVYTYWKPTDPDVRLAIVTASAQTASDAVTWVKVVDKEPMGFEDAMDRARRYSTESGIDLILWRDGTKPHFFCRECDRHFPVDEVLKPSTTPLSPTEPSKPANLCPECQQVLVSRSGQPES